MAHNKRLAFRSSRFCIARASCLALLLATCSPLAFAGGPRFVTGTTYSGVAAGTPMAFYTSSPAYYTDPGDLNAAVSHTQADALVAAAAATWNVPTSSIVLAQGGELAEHVSSANTYIDPNSGAVDFPPDVSASNWENIPIAIIYDEDGSVIDTLLGEDASDPSGCRQTGVVESSDGFGQTGTLEHAEIILNGRCVGSDPDQLPQMQYQVERAFGRVLGLAWSQVNDNIFTGATPPTAGEIDYWPVMHPIDVLCGAYTYQCMTNPGQLRADDLSALAQLYPVTNANTAGKTQSWQNAVGLTGTVLFPTGQGMDWVNVTVTRELPNHTTKEAWQVASGITGLLYQQNGGNAVSGAESVSENTGKAWSPVEGQVVIQRVPDASVENIYMNTEPINPLYTGDYALGPYERPPVMPSGTTASMTDWSAIAGTGGAFSTNAPNAAATCTPPVPDGKQAAPATSDPSGLWNGLLCSVGHTSWWSVAARANRSWTIEVTALDETAAATTVKAQPVIGLWSAGDTGLPTVASSPVSMNSWAPGVTQLQVSASSTDGAYTFAVADQYGGGRPDFGYQARVLYADSVSPATVGSAGGEITITGEGFLPGNSVYVNYTPATVISLTATQIVATAPDMTDAGMNAGQPADVTVMDENTGGSATISGGISYASASPDVIALVSAPTSLETKITAATPFAVRVFAPDGVTPQANASVQFSASAGTALLGACNGGSACLVQTDTTGLAQTTVAGLAPGPVTLTATEITGGASVTVNLTDTDPIRTLTIANPPGYFAAGASATWTLSLTATQDGAAATNVPILWSATSGLTFGAGTMSTGSTGAASMIVNATQLASGPATVTACAWTTVCTTWTVDAIAPSLWTVQTHSGAGQTVSGATAFTPVSVEVTDGAGHSLQGAAVTIYQTVDAWEGACPSQSRCPAAPVLTASTSSAISDANGLVTITPLEVPNIPQTTNIAVITGTQGFVSFSLTRTP